MAGQALTLFGQWTNETGLTMLKGPRERVQDAQRTNHRILGYLMRGQQMSEMLQGGQYIRDIVYLDTQTTALFYHPNEPIARTNKQSGTPWRVDWRFWEDHFAYTDHEIKTNAGASAEELSQQYKDVLFGKMQDMYASWSGFVDDALWAPPDTTQMESSTGKLITSIPAGINEFPNGLYPATAPGGAWTTFQQINPSTYPNWVPYQNTYTAADTIDQTLLAALDDAWLSLDFQPPPHGKEYFESPTAEPINIVCTSKNGVKNLKAIYRANNDRWEDMKDPFFNPLYGGAPVLHVAALDSAAIFPTGTGSTQANSALSTETDTTSTIANGNAGPRYFLIQPKYLRMVFCADRFMFDLGEMTPTDTPTSHFRAFDTWGNTVFRSRKRHGIIYPGADVTSPVPNPTA